MSINVQKNVSLRQYTTLGVGGSAEYFVEIENEEQLVEAVLWAKENAIATSVLGGGSNILVDDKGVGKLVIRMKNKGYTHNVFDDVVRIAVQAGEQLDDIVALCVDAGWWGIENLSHIPGTVGATPVQNVGAYGVEVKDIIESVRAFNCETEAFEILQNSECKFSYRDSLFKSDAGKKYIVTEVTFILSTTPHEKISYKDLTNYFNDASPSLREIRAAIIEIRSKKFPDWKQVGTAGSFFKNPTITTSTYVELQKKYPLLPGFEVAQGQVKISLGWVLDKVLHLKGYSDGPVATYDNQALVLIAQKTATAEQVENFANEIIERIRNEIGVSVEWEVTKLK